jgi:hypothetical protein
MPSPADRSDASTDMLRSNLFTPAAALPACASARPLETHHALPIGDFQRTPVFVGRRWSRAVFTLF